ncbi:N-acetylmuramoyl-L-alanine amidase [Patescibacteria group bacterium]|nr:N-acetylmuramoyl-L-alanine amidase [Patescibacteria group bacterium]
MKYLIAMAVVAGVSGAGWWGWQVTTAREAVVSDYEQEFEGSEAMLATTNETPPAIPVPPLPPAPTTTTYLPPLPEPLNEEGRTRWAAYWEPMTPEEESVYGPRERLPGPPRVGIQVGHWQREALPEELNGLTGSSGANAGGYTEEEVNIMVAREVVKLLTAAGVEVDLLPVAIPIDYRADAFISIHADGSSNTAVSGFKFAPPRTDFSGRAGELVAALYASYESVPRYRATMPSRAV